MTLTRRSALLGAAGLLGACATRAPSQPAWASAPPMPWAAQEIYAAVAGGKVYVAGGLTGPAPGSRSLGILDRTGVYDPRTDRWSEGPRLPQPIHHPVLAAVGGRVFAIGGFRAVAEGQWSGQREVLALDGDRWMSAGALPAPQSESVALEQGGRIHLLTGRTPGGSANANWQDQADTDAHRIFDPTSGRWTGARPAPAPRNSAAGAVIGGMLYLVGGRTVAGGNMDRLDRYDPRTDAWESLAPLPQASGGLAAAALDGRLYAFGGEYFGPGGRGVYPHTWIYDPREDRWSAGPPMLTPRHGLAGAAVAGRVLAIGGASQAGAAETTAIVEALTA